MPTKSVILLLFFVFCLARAQTVKEPFHWTQGYYRQAVTYSNDGKYASEGALLNADELPASGPGFVHLFRSRWCYFGTYDLIEILKYAAAKIHERFPERSRLRIGDLSQMFGGPIEYYVYRSQKNTWEWELRHSSHQNGLDADIAYYSKGLRDFDPDPELTNGFETDFVVDGRVSSRFDTHRNWEFIKVIYETGRLSRVFVDPAIKRAFCEHARTRKEHQRFRTLLRNIQSLHQQHGDHMHLRITCPMNSPECIDLPPSKDPKEDCPSSRQAKPYPKRGKTFSDGKDV